MNTNQPHAMDVLQAYAELHGWEAMLLDVASLCQHKGDRMMKAEGIERADHYYRAADIIENASKTAGVELETV